MPRLAVFSAAALGGILLISSGAAALFSPPRTAALPPPAEERTIIRKIADTDAFADKRGQEAPPQNASLEIIAPWAKEMPHYAKTGAGYFELRNNSNKAVRLYAVETDIAEKVEIHSMIIQDNIMKMRHLGDGIEIPRHSTLIFKPGSYHLMFINPKIAFKSQEKFTARFKFMDGEQLQAEFNIYPARSKAEAAAGGKPPQTDPAMQIQHK